MDVNAQLVEAFFKISRLMKDEMGYDSDLLRLSMLQLQVLMYLKRNPDTQMSEVASHFQIELPSATSLINTLARLKLAQRNADKKDRRLVRIALTPKGLKLLVDAMKQRGEKMKHNLNYLSSEDKKSLLAILERFTAQLEKKHEK